MRLETDEQMEELYFKMVGQEETRHAQDYVFGEILSGQGDDFALSPDYMQALAAAVRAPMCEWKP